MLCTVYHRMLDQQKVLGHCSYCQGFMDEQSRAKREFGSMPELPAATVSG